jgi:methylated-DNA-[protein]-cysteine S-methyltransferase
MGFSGNVFQAAKKVPAGKVTTYSEIARCIGSPNAARAVGNALAGNRNPHYNRPAQNMDCSVPCHRVVRSDGAIGGFLGKRGAGPKAGLLRAEGVAVKHGRIDMKLFFFRLC